MEQTDHKNLKTLSQFSRYQFLKKITQLLLSVSVFSLLLSNSSRLSFLHSLNFYFSTVPVQLFTHTIDKKCMFLLCNGLLVFVAKFSGLVTSSSAKNTYNNNIETIKSYDEVLESNLTLLENEESNNFVNGESNDQEIRDIKESTHQEEFIVEDEKNQEFLIVEKESEVIVQENYQEEVIEFDDKFPVLDQEEEEEEEEEYEDEDEDEDEDEENEMLSTEELNKKFEEFIRKMKEGIRIEAQQQLVMVN